MDVLKSVSSGQVRRAFGALLERQGAFGVAGEQCGDIDTAGLGTRGVNLILDRVGFS